MIDVCCAIILDGDQILAVQRGPESYHPFLWEFPGGKIQDGETASQCVIREIAEELNVTIGIITELDAVKFDYSNKQIRLIPFVSKVISGEIILNEHINLCWFVLYDWESINWSGADRQLILKNMEKMRKIFQDKS